MNYSHRYHAGNFADVVKHVILSLLLQHFLKKETPFCFIDTHAGAGLYDLNTVEAKKTGEYGSGIVRLLAGKEHLPNSLKPYLDIIDYFQPDKAKQLMYYPGSPWIANHFLREQDEMILNEKHPDAVAELKTNFRHHPQAAIHERDAYELLPAILPPKIKRALILIDPPFEKKTELNDIINALEKCLQRFPQGMYVIWLPITDKKSRFIIPNDLRALLPKDKYLFIEFSVAEECQAHIMSQGGLLGSGFIIINPPWQFEKEIKPILKSVWSVLSKDQHGGWRLFK